VLARATEGDVVAIAVTGERIAAITSDRVTMLDAGASALFETDASAHAPVSVAITEHARFVITAGADGSLRVFGADGASLGATDVADPVAVRVDPRGRAIVTASRDGVVRAFECAAP
jgi:hypothetical protein